jgi:KDO2-lipid IV(A) lauroyltransferase
MTARHIPPARRARYALEAALVFIAYCFFSLFPLGMASATGGFILRRIGPHLPVTAVARRNLSRAFPEKGAAELEKIVTGMWENIGRVIGEYPHLSRLWRRVELEGKEFLSTAAGSGKSAIFCGGHFANWEINAIAAKNAGIDLHLVYRRPNNPYVDGLLRHVRSSGVSGHIAKGAEGARAMLSVLKKNGSLGILADQKLNEGIPVPFFGREAMTATAIAAFALKFDCPVYPVRIERRKGAHFKMTVFPALNLPQTGDKEKDTRAMLVEMNRLFEEWIRARPEQWLWIHRRWPD